MEKQKKEWLKPELNQLDINNKTKFSISAGADAAFAGSQDGQPS